MKTLIQRLIPMVVLGGAMLSAAPYAAAGDAGARGLDPAVAVRFSDLSASTPEGARVLYGRIVDAAQTVCGPSASLWDADAYRNWKTCYRATVDHVVRQINRPQLTALHQSLTGPRQIAANAAVPLSRR